jgi:PilZ domain-containing protein
MACSATMAQRSKVKWFRGQSLQCVVLALRMTNPRIKRLCALEAERWLRLTELKMDGRAVEYLGVERRMTPRHQTPKTGVILLERAFRVECMVRDFSPAGAGLLLPDPGNLPDDFYLTFDHAVRRCSTVWRQPDRIGVKFKSMAGAWKIGG